MHSFNQQTERRMDKKPYKITERARIACAFIRQASVPTNHCASVPPAGMFIQAAIPETDWLPVGSSDH
jgi:hypothetical protein